MRFKHRIDNELEFHIIGGFVDMSGNRCEDSNRKDSDINKRRYDDN